MSYSYEFGKFTSEIKEWKVMGHAGSYVGQWTDKPQGFGLFYNEGMLFEGYWEAGIFQGYGRSFVMESPLSAESPVMLQGRFEDNQISNFGKMRSPSTHYRGMFKDNMFHGFGNLYDSQDTQWQGIFHNGSISGVAYTVSGNDEVWIGTVQER